MNSICTDIKSNSTEANVGKILEHARQNHTIKDLNVIAKELCISAHLLEALEQGNFDSFPSACYATGFLKNYATYLGLDPREIVSRYEMEFAGSKESVVLSFPEAPSHEYFSMKKAAGIATLCFAIFAGVWSNLDRLDAEETKEVFAPTNMRSEVVSQQTVTPAPQEDSLAVSSEIRLQALRDVWIRLSDKQGNVRVEKILTKGEDLVAPEKEGLSLMTNDAAALSVIVNDIAVHELGGDGEIIEDIKLEQQKLLELSMLH